jgi:chromosome segregation ATPase
MENVSVIEQLSKRIDDVLARLKRLEEENGRLRNEVVTLKAQNEAKEAQIGKLSEELAMKDLEIEEVIGKIEAMLGD